jgi:hypothetical protein
MEPSAFQYPTQPPKKNNLNPMLVVGGVLLVAFVVSFLIIRQPKKVEEKKETVVIENSTPSPTEVSKIDKKTVKIQVQNGTGTPGQAGLVVKDLERAGFLVDNIKTGNAEAYDNKTTIITTKENFAQVIPDIEDSLKSTFDKFAVGSPNLGSTSEFDVVIVTGGKIFESPTLAPTSTSTPTLTVTPKP